MPAIMPMMASPVAWMTPARVFTSPMRPGPAAWRSATRIMRLVTSRSSLFRKNAMAAITSR